MLTTNSIDSVLLEQLIVIQPVKKFLILRKPKVYRHICKGVHIWIIVAQFNTLVFNGEVSHHSQASRLEATFYQLPVTAEYIPNIRIQYSRDFNTQWNFHVWFFLGETNLNLNVRKNNLRIFKIELSHTIDLAPKDVGTW
jgi:hypothetical protein